MYLVYRQIKGETYVGKLMYFVVCLAIVNAIAVVVRVNALFPHDPNTYNFESFQIAYCFEEIGFYGAFWFYSIKYYETATDT